MLKLEHVKTGYGSMPVVHDASFHVKAGTIMALLGSNGSGKTSLLRAIFGTLPIMAGAIEYKGQSIVGTKSYRMVEMGISVEDIRAELASRHVIDHKVKQEKMT